MVFGSLQADHELGCNEKSYGPTVQHIDDFDPSRKASIPEGKDVVIDAEASGRVFQAPEFIRNWTFEERQNAEARLRKKIDIRLMPMVVIMYIMNYLDRNNIAAARLAGLEADLGLSSVQFSTSVSILFVGYILMQVPSNLFLNKIGKPALYLPTAMVIWGCISTATAACNSFGGLLACRFLLGFIEAAYFPGCLYYLSCWYTRKELGFRTAILYSGSLISGAFSGLITAGITSGMDNLHGLRAWRWLFIVEGSVTVGIAIAAYFILPNFPRTTKWLTHEEKELAAWRLAEDIGQDDWLDSQHQSFWQGMKMAFTDIKTYILGIILFTIVSSGTVTNFFPSVVQTLGYNNTLTLLLTAPPYVLAVITAFLNAWHADRTGERYLHIVIPCCVALASFIIAVSTTSLAPRYFAIVIMVPGVYTGYVVVLAWISNTLPRPPAKRAAALGAINAFSNSCQIYSSYLYPSSAAPRYTAAFIHNCVMSLTAIVFATILRFMLVRLNKKLEKGEYVKGAVNGGGFRYRV